MGLFSFRSIKTNNFQVFPAHPASQSSANNFVSACIHKGKLVFGLAGTVPNISIMNSNEVIEAMAATPFFGNVGMCENGSRIFTSTSSGNVNYSDDGGLTWASVSASPTAPNCGAMACNGNTICLVSNGGIRTSLDNGATWFWGIQSTFLDWSMPIPGFNNYKGILKYFPQLGLFVCGGNRNSGPTAGKIIYSSDGVNWVAGPVFIGNIITTMELLSGKFYIFGGTGLGSTIYKMNQNLSGSAEVLVNAASGMSFVNTACVFNGTVYAFGGGSPFYVLKLVNNKFVILPSNLAINVGAGGQFAIVFNNKIWTCGQSTNSANLFSIMQSY